MTEWQESCLPLWTSLASAPMNPRCPSLLGSVLFYIAQPLCALAQTELPLPLELESVDAAHDSLTLVPDPAAVEALRGVRRARFMDVAMPGGDVLVLELEQRELRDLRIGVQVQGETARGLLDELGLSVWSGIVQGDPESSVFLCFSQYGCRGWIRSVEELVTWDAVLGEDLDWSRSRVRVSRATGFDEPADWSCEPAPGGPDPGPMFLGCTPPTTGAAQGLLEASIAVETDHQLFRVFGDVRAQLAYVTALLAAVSERFEEQLGVRLIYPYLALYPESDDPWFWDADANCSTIWIALRDAWGGGNIPAGGHLGHFLSGTRLPCGVAQRNSLCDPEWGFSVSGGIHGGTTFPVTEPSPLARDFFVVAHELGHNFGSAHTNQACPPIDSCAPDWLFGPCQTEQVCTRGTIMSTCMMCPGRWWNIWPYFHPAVATRLRQRAEASCIPRAGG